MGQFSWFTQDVHKQIKDNKKADVYMVDPRDGTAYKETCYEGYGIFGGRDFYELLADINKDIIFWKNNHQKDYDNDNLKEIFSKDFKDLTDDELTHKRNLGIDLWFAYIEPDQFSKWAFKLRPRDKVICPILVRDQTSWRKFVGKHPESDPDQGW